MKKIVVIGPESTGKSTICRQLAEHYHTVWCPEYARQFLLENGKHYDYDNLLTIARGQLALETKMAGKAENTLFFIDTDMYVMKVWSEFVFGKCHPWIIDQIVERHYDLYLLCNTDLPWVKDELREYPDLETRRRLYHIYRDIMINQDTPWTTISGNDETRLQQAIAAVEEYILHQ
jgi:NadR type nicotinamide-nucleotide adenylyltransferase